MQKDFQLGHQTSTAGPEQLARVSMFAIDKKGRTIWYTKTPPKRLFIPFCRSSCQLLRLPLLLLSVLLLVMGDNVVEVRAVTGGDIERRARCEYPGTSLVRAQYTSVAS